MFFRKLVLTTALAAAPLPAAAETLFALTFPVNLPFWTSPPPIYSDHPLGYIESGMRLCAKSTVFTAYNFQYRQLVIANGQIIYINTSEGFPGGIRDPANDQKCQQNAALYAQQSNPRYAQVFGPAVLNASPHHDAGGNVPVAGSPPPVAQPPSAMGNEIAGGALAEALALEERRNWIGASDLLRPLAEQGNAQAQLHMGIVIRKCGCLPGFPKVRGPSAREWFEKAAAQGNVQADAELGELYRIMQAYPEAISRYQKAADGGVAKGQAGLGLMYEQGLGVGQDLVQAGSWYRRAAAQGLPEAQQALARINAKQEEDARVAERAAKLPSMLSRRKQVGDTVCQSDGSIIGQVYQVSADRILVVMHMHRAGIISISPYQRSTPAQDWDVSDWVKYNQVIVCE